MSDILVIDSNTPNVLAVISGPSSVGPVYIEQENVPTIVEMQTQGPPGPPGPTGVGTPGPKGDDGYTPIKGIDYFDGAPGTPGAKGDKGDDGYTPIKGVDYFDGDPGETGPPGTTQWSGITDKPTSFTPSSHGNEAHTTPYVGTGDARLSDARTPLGHKSSHGVGGSDSLFPLERATFNTTVDPPTYDQGQLYWDKVNKTLAIQTSPETTLQIGQESVIQVYNNTGITISNGTPVYISGVFGNIPTIAIAKASEMTAPRTIAITTQDIATGTAGVATTFGLVHDINTSALVPGDQVYLGALGGFTNTRPIYPNAVVQIGTCTYSNAVTGELHVSISPDTFQKGFDVMKQPIGVFNRAESTITYNSGTQQFSISPVGAYWAFFNSGIEYRQTTTLTLTHPATTGGHFFYLRGADNVLVTSASPWDLLVDIPLCYVYFNATTGEGYAFEERHGATRNPEWHRGQHINIGTYFVSGLAATGYTLNTTTNSAIQFGIDSGIIRDEDISNVISPQIDGGTYNVLWRNGANGDWRITESTMPFIFTTYVEYNQFTGTTWQMTPLTSGDYLNIYVVAVPGINSAKQIMCIPGQNKYTNLTNANNASFTNDISWGAIPFQEFSVIHKFVLRTGTSYGSSGKVRIEAYSDLRGTTTRIQVAGGSASSHNSLAGLNTGDYLHLTQAEYDARLLEAPIDGKQYARKDGAWIEVVGGNTMATFDAVLDFNRGSMVATTTVIDPTMTTTKIIQAFYTDHLDEVAVLDLQVRERTRTAGVGFDIIGVAKSGAFGTYPIRVITQGV